MILWYNYGLWSKPKAFQVSGIDARFQICNYVNFKCRSSVYDSKECKVTCFQTQGDSSLIASKFSLVIFVIKKKKASHFFKDIEVRKQEIFYFPMKLHFYLNWSYIVRFQR